MRRVLVVIAATIVSSATVSTAVAEEPIYVCKRPEAAVRVDINIKVDYTLADVAIWWMASSCSRVVVDRQLLGRASAKGLRTQARGGSLRPILDKLVARLDVAVVIDGDTTVFIDADALGRPAPDLVVTFGGSRTTTPAPQPRPAPSTELEAAIASIRKKSEGHFIVPRSTVDLVLANPASLSGGVRIVPSIKNGAANGFKLYAIRPSSVYAAIGLHNGDTVHSINGHELDTPDKALDVYTKVRDARRLTLQITRRGKPFTLRIDVKKAPSASP